MEKLLITTVNKALRKRIDYFIFSLIGLCRQGQFLLTVSLLVFLFKHPVYIKMLEIQMTQLSKT